ncbi:MAG: hypothetical protein HKN48_09695 [Flavobacteriaceae bacterium]|nr:hypothetical protein [Flavobacteriaceae bacterium]
MNKIIICAVLCISLLFTGCEEPLVYKYQDKAQPIECSGIDKALLHEALYSFKEDLGHFYKDPDVRAGSDRFYMLGLATYVEDGLLGLADYKKIASPHTLKVFEELKMQEQIWDENSEVSNFDYNSEFANCLFDNIIDEEIKSFFKRLKEVDALDPKQIANLMRRKIYKAYTDHHLTMYIAMDGFYQHLYELDKKGN